MAETLLLSFSRSLIDCCDRCRRDEDAFRSKDGFRLMPSSGGASDIVAESRGMKRSDWKGAGDSGPDEGLT